MLEAQRLWTWVWIIYVYKMSWSTWKQEFPITGRLITSVFLDPDPEVPKYNTLLLEQIFRAAFTLWQYTGDKKASLHCSHSTLVWSVKLWKQTNGVRYHSISHMHLSDFTVYILTLHLFTVTVGRFCTIMINGQYWQYANKQTTSLCWCISSGYCTAWTGILKPLPSSRLQAWV